MPSTAATDVPRRWMRIFLPGWGATAEVWAPFAAPGDRLGGEIEAGADVVAWSLGAMQALEAATETELGRSPSSAPRDSSCAATATARAGPSAHSYGMRERLAREPAPCWTSSWRSSWRPAKSWRTRCRANKSPRFSIARASLPRRLLDARARLRTSTARSGSCTEAATASARPPPPSSWPRPSPRPS